MADFVDFKAGAINITQDADKGRSYKLLAANYSQSLPSPCCLLFQETLKLFYGVTYANSGSSAEQNKMRSQLAAQFMPFFGSQRVF